VHLYKKWVTKTLPLVAVFIAISTLVPLSLLNMNFRDDSLCGKEYLLGKNPKIIFAGDSRAERQLNPLVASRLLHLDKDDVVNIAVTAGDPLMIEGLIDRYPEVFSKATVILSLSANLINDGAKGRKYFSTAMIAKLTVFQQISMLLPFHFRTWKNYYRSALYQVLGIQRDDCNNEYTETNGFYPVSGEIDVEALNGTAVNADTAGNCKTNHPWYMEYNSSGRKAQLLRQSLQAIAPRIGKLIVFTGPFNPSYLRSISNSPLYEYEMDFETKLAAMCRELHIPFKRFTEHPLLRDQNFYDSAHLNAAGADLFTEIVTGEFLDSRKPVTQ